MIFLITFKKGSLISPCISPFVGSWTSDTGMAITVEDGGWLTLFDGTSFTTVTGSFFIENGENKVTFQDAVGNDVIGIISADGSIISFDSKSTLYSEWTKGQTSITTTTVTETTTVATTPAATTATTTTAAATSAATTALPVTTVTVASTAAVISTTAAAGAGVGVIEGDPHVKIQIPGEEAVCFDVHTEGNQLILLLADQENKIFVTGKLEQNVNRNRLTVIGVTTRDGHQIEIHANFVVINGVQIGLEEDRFFRFSDFNVEMVSHFKARHRGCIIYFQSGPSFHVSSKDAKESLRFEIVSSEGLSNKIGGLLGLPIRSHDYHISDDGAITVEKDRVITTAKRTWMEHSYCHILSSSSVPIFLGTSPATFVVSTLFPDDMFFAMVLLSEDPK